MPQVTVTTSGSEILPYNSYRKSVSFHNIDTANFIFIENMPPNGITTGNAGIRLGPNDKVTYNLLDDGVEQVQGQWSAIANTGSNTLLVKETNRKLNER
jgi:hypothetical protein